MKTRSLAELEAEEKYLEKKIKVAIAKAEKADQEGKFHMLWGRVCYYKTQWMQLHGRIEEFKKKAYGIE